MIIINEKEKCNGCHACYNICPQKAIEMIEDEKGFKYPKVDQDKCIECGLCEKICPILNKKENKEYENRLAYACINTNEIVRENSSSGGVFSLIAEDILEKDGIVVGAAFDNDFSVKHVIITNKEDLHKLRTSKYVQSNIGDIYNEVKKQLELEKDVLFTGTPCQINGLISFLNKKYENLYTQDIICHGVPSPKVWKKYLEFRKKEDNSEPININFRKKTEGWKIFSLNFEYDNDKKHDKNLTKDLYLKAFLNDICLRDSCYDCKYKEKNRIADITLADFWGIQNVLPEMDDDGGTSLVIVNTEKGTKLFDRIKEKMKYKEVDYEESIKYNPALYNSAGKHKDSDKFFNELNSISFDKLVNKYIRKDGILRRILRKCKNIIKRIVKRK